MVLSNLQGKNLKKQDLIKMKFQLRICQKCKKYYLKEKCKNCNNETISPHPAKFSPDDKYMRYRIRDKFENNI